MSHQPISLDQLKAMQTVLTQKFYTYKENPYEVLKIVNHKCPYYGHWYLSVEYKALYELDGGWMGHFSRHIEYFVSEFTPTC